MIVSRSSMRRIRIRIVVVAIVILVVVVLVAITSVVVSHRLFFICCVRSSSSTPVVAHSCGRTFTELCATNCLVDRRSTQWRTKELLAYYQTSHARFSGIVECLLRKQRHYEHRKYCRGAWSHGSTCILAT